MGCQSIWVLVFSEVEDLDDPYIVGLVSMDERDFLQFAEE
jgi:hypothetical protein